MLSVLLVFCAEASFVRRTEGAGEHAQHVAPDGSVAEYEAAVSLEPWDSGVLIETEYTLGSIRHSACAKKGHRDVLFSDDFSKFSVHYAHKVKELETAVNVLRVVRQDGVSTDSTFWTNAKKVSDRMDGFLKCAEVQVTPGSPGQQIKSQIIANHRTGYMAMSRKGAAELFAALYMKEGQADSDVCHLDGRRLDAVLNAEATQFGGNRGHLTRMGTRLDGGAGEDDTYENAIHYVFQPAGCLDELGFKAERASVFMASYTAGGPHPELMTASKAVLAVEALQAAFSVVEARHTTTGLRDSRVDERHVDQDRYSMLDVT